MNQIQYFMRERIYEDTTGKRTILPPIIIPNLPATSSCSAPACDSCMLGRSKKRLSGATNINPY